MSHDAITMGSEAYDFNLGERNMNGIHIPHFSEVRD